MPNFLQNTTICFEFVDFLQKILLSKGQIMSECIYEIIDFPKYHRKHLIDFCLGRFYRQGTCDLF